MKVLVIDDSRAMRSILGTILRVAGHEVDEACQGEEGLERLRSGERPDVVLVDWNMPVMDGLRFVEAVRRDPDCDAVRLVMVTTEADRMAEALATGADDYLSKPFTKEAILGKLERLGLGLGAPS